MVDEGDLAAALIAKLASNDLGMVDQFTEKRQSSGAANRLDPMAFVQRARPNNNFASQQNMISEQQQQAILEQANRMAEQLHPLPPPPVIREPEPQQRAISLFEDINNVEFSAKLDTINDSLQLINNTLLTLVDTFKK